MQTMTLVDVAEETGPQDACPGSNDHSTEPPGSAPHPTQLWRTCSSPLIVSGRRAESIGSFLFLLLFFSIYVCMYVCVYIYIHIYIYGWPKSSFGFLWLRAGRTRCLLSEVADSVWKKAWLGYHGTPLSSTAGGLTGEGAGVETGTSTQRLLETVKQRTSFRLPGDSGQMGFTKARSYLVNQPLWTEASDWQLVLATKQKNLPLTCNWVSALPIIWKR